MLDIVMGTVGLCRRSEDAMTDRQFAVTVRLDQGAKAMVVSALSASLRDQIMMVVPNCIAGCYLLYWLKLPQKRP